MVIVQEAECCLRALCLGLVLMAAYDVLRIARDLIPHSTYVIGIEDFLYWMGSAVSVFGLLYNYNFGVIRWFVILGVFVGMFVYQSSIGRIRKKVTKLLKKRLKKRKKRSRMILTDVLCRKGKNRGDAEQSFEKKEKKTTSE